MAPKDDEENPEVVSLVASREPEINSGEEKKPASKAWVGIACALGLSYEICWLSNL